MWPRAGAMLEAFRPVQKYCQSLLCCTMQKINNGITASLLQRTAMLLTGRVALHCLPPHREKCAPAMRRFVEVLGPLVYYIEHGVCGVAGSGLLAIDDDVGQRCRSTAYIQRAECDQHTSCLPRHRQVFTRSRSLHLCSFQFKLFLIRTCNIRSLTSVM